MGFHRFTLLAAALIAVLTAQVLAEVKPNSLFSDGAVLQQGISVPVWGTADDGERVTVEIQGQKVSTVAEDGRWMVRLKPLKAGGPYTLKINSIELKNVLVGEVWVCSGQSNMGWTLASSTNGDEHVKSSADQNLRLFTAPHLVSKSPQESVDGSWAECGPDTVGGFSAVGYFFGRDLRKAIGVPVGLINASFGGTSVQPWIPYRSIENPAACRAFARTKPEHAQAQNMPSVLYNGMIAPLIPYAIRGVIWYQGESNAGEAYNYRRLFPTMIKSWREDWGQGDFPFLFVQLAPFHKVDTEPQESAWAELREAQLLTTVNCPNTGMAVITDFGDPVDIHPKQKEPVGARLALAAEAIAYGKRIVYSGPVYKSMKIKGDSVVLSFDSVGSGLMAKDGELTGFTIAGEDRRFVNAKAEIDGNTVVVTSPDVVRPAAVRYGWADCPVVNLYNKEGLPASPFRTDDFPILTGPK